MKIQQNKNAHDCVNCTILKAFIKLDKIKMMIHPSVFEGKKTLWHMGKWSLWDYQYFLLSFPTVFSRALSFWVINTQDFVLSLCQTSNFEIFQTERVCKGQLQF